MSTFLATTTVESTIFSVLGNLLYPLFQVFFVVIDQIQSVFYSFAGVRNEILVADQTVSSDFGFSDTDNGIIYYMLRSKTVQNIFISMVVLAVFLIVIFTILAFIRNMYQTKQKRWQEIISSSIKGIINFIFLPVCCLLGVAAGNVLLRALNEATSFGTEVTMSRQLFVSSAYNANKFRKDWVYNEEDVQKLINDYDRVVDKSSGNININEQYKGKIELGKTGYYYAEFVDEMYRSSGENAFDLWDVADVYPYYDTWNINYLLLGAGGVFMLFALIKVTFGMLKRIFMIMMLYIISPVVCSLYPLDDGSAVGKWRGEFTKQFFSAYSAVVGMNLFFILVPLLNSITWGGL